MWKGSSGSVLPAPTQRTCGPKRSKRWRPKKQYARIYTSRCSRAATGCWPKCTEGIPLSVTSSGWERRGRQVPDLAVTTDIIVGFPGEEESDFVRTLEVAAEAEYDSAYTFIFSPRPGTEAAAETADFVPPEIAAERFERLRQVVERSALRRHSQRVGQTEEVLIEGPAKKGGPDVYSGRSRQNKLVHLEGNGLRPGTVVDVLVEQAAPHFLKGKLVRVVAQPRHRNLIPVAAS